MVELELFIVDKNDTSWSLRPWLLLVHYGIPFVLGERPLAAHIGARFAGTVQERVVAGPSYAVVFESQRSSEPSDYGAVADRMETLAASMPGYQSHRSARGADGFGITVSYWDSLESIANFRAELEHAEAQRAGRARYYTRYELRVARVEKHVGFDAARSPARVEAR